MPGSTIKKDIPIENQVQKHVVIAVHGIRTFAEWYERLRALLRGAKPSIETEKLHFGYFSAFLLIFPWFRKHAVDRYATILLHRLRRLNGYRIDVVAHSFGTLVVATALERLKKEAVLPPAKPPIENLILAGSVLKHEFPWHEYSGSFISRITNDCGTRDFPLLACMLLLVGLGYGGRRGFDAVECEHFLNRFFPFGHSGFFKKKGKPYDEFMRRYWVPIITTDSPIEEVPNPRHRGKIASLIAWLETWADPIKIFVHCLVLVFPVATVVTLYIGERQARELALANLQAVESLSKISIDGTQSLQAAMLSAAKHDSPEINAVLKANVDLLAFPVNRLTHQSSSGISIAAAHPKLPIFAVSFTRPKKNVVSIIDANAGKEIGFFVGTSEKNDSCQLGSPPTGLRFSPSGSYLIVESLAGICIWSMQEKRVIFSGNTKQRIEISPDERFAIAVDGVASQWQRTDLIDLSTREVKPLNIKLGPHDDVNLSGKGFVFTKYKTLFVQNFGSEKIRAISAPGDGHFMKLSVPKSGKFVIAATTVGEFIAIDVDNGRILWRKNVGQELRHIAYSADEKLVAIQLGDGSSIIWRSNDAVEVMNLKTTGVPEGIQFVGNDSNFIMTHNRRHDLKIWNLTNYTLWRKIPRDPYQEGFAVSADGKYLISGGPDKSVVIWDLKRPEMDTRRFLQIESEVQQVSLDNLAQKLAVLGSEGDITYWDTVSNISPKVNEKTRYNIPFLQTTALDGKGEFAIIQTAAGDVRRVDLSTGKERWKFRLPSFFSNEFERDDQQTLKSIKTTMSFSPEGIALPIKCPSKSPYVVRASAGERAESKLLFPSRTCTALTKGEPTRGRDVATGIFRSPIRISPSGKFALVPILDQIVVLDTNGGRHVATLSVGFDPQANDLLSLDLGEGIRLARLRDVTFLDDDSIAGISHGNLLWTWGKIDNRFSEGVMHAIPAAKRFQAFSGPFAKAFFYDTESGVLSSLDLKSMKEATLDRLARINGIYVDRESGHRRIAVITSEASDLIVIGEGLVRAPYYVDIWDEARRKKLLSINADTPVKKVAFSNSGEYVAISDSLGVIRIYSISDGVERSRIHRGEDVNTLAFVDGDKYILSSTGPGHTYPATTGANAIQLDLWKTNDLVKIACIALQGLGASKAHCGT